MCVKLINFILISSLDTPLSNGSGAPSSAGLGVDVSRMPFGTNATHDPTEVPKTLWTRWKSLDVVNKHKPTSTSI